ncbi:MAG: aspartate aminotransferase family protein [Phycisphaerales bacterium]|nr:aspartate aminotransferase family protein [Phycisphaerales bacterium]
MATREFPLTPVDVPQVETKNRRIKTQIPHPDSIATLTKLRNMEPRSMGGQPPILWHHGHGATVSDAYGNQWLDFSAGVLVTASGHGHPAIIKAITDMANQGLYHSYCFPTTIREQLVAEITSWLPAPLARVFLLSTGSEAAECCIKLARTQGQKINKDKNILVTYESAFHGRTLGSQLAGGSAALKAWIGELDPRFVQVPYPDGFRQKDVSFELFERSLKEKGVDPDRVCGVMSETYQGGNATMFTPAYGQALRKWCDKHKALLIFDEIQAGFGRTGKAFGFQHLGIVPDLVACGKGISGGMPLSAVLGIRDVMDLYGPGEMTSTHSANPICSAAALANLQVIRNEKLIENAAKLSPILAEGCKEIQAASKGRIGHFAVCGLVASMQFTQVGTTTPDPDLAWELVHNAIQQGVMLFAPVGFGGAAVKLNPPLVIDEASLREGLVVLREIMKKIA